MQRDSRRQVPRLGSLTMERPLDRSRPKIDDPSVPPRSNARQAADFERRYKELFEQLAPAADGPVVHPNRRRRGRLVFGDAIE